MSPVELILLLIFTVIAYLIGYWHGSRIGAMQGVRALVQMQHRTAITIGATTRLSSSTSQGQVPLEQATLTPHEAQIIDLFLEGKNASGIVAILYGYTLEAGQPYMDKMSEVQAVIRTALSRLYRDVSSYDD